MNRLISLAEKPATKEDIGKSIYDSIGKEYGIIFYDDTDSYINISPGLSVADNTPYLFWSKPVVVDEEEYQALQKKARQ